MRITRRGAVKALLATALGGVSGTAVYGAAIERHRIGVTRAALPVSGLPPALDGLRVGLLTDVHHSALVPADDVSAALDLIRTEGPDLIVLGGDYVTFADQAYIGPVAELLAGLSAPHGVFAVLGNHDDDRNVPAALAAKGFTVLRDERTEIAVRHEALTLAGLRFWTRDRATIARVAGGARGTTLLLAHDPRRLRDAAALGVQAVLAGHTHGGQVVLPGVGALGRRRFPVLQGVARQGATSMFVSRGLGTVYVPIRINCPPEVALVTLTAHPS